MLSIDCSLYKHNLQVEPPDRKWQYLLFAAEPYETISFKVKPLANCPLLLSYHISLLSSRPLTVSYAGSLKGG